MYDINTLTCEEFKELIRRGNDTQDNQIRVTATGQIYISSIVGAENISEIKFRLETFEAGNGYVGPKAAEDSDYIAKMYKVVKNCWESGQCGYIDFY